MKNYAITIFACLVCLAVGYVGGREHIKYQMRAVMQDAVKGFQSGLADATANDRIERESKISSTVLSEQPIIAALLEKGFSPKDVHNSKYGEEILLDVKFTNQADKAIRAFDGTIEFTDLLDNRIMAVRVEINESIAQGSFLAWEGVLEYNQFMREHERLRSEPIENLKVVFHTGKILFTDGTTENFE